MRTTTRITSSIVVFDTAPKDLDDLLRDLGSCPAVSHIVVVDNSGTDRYAKARRRPCVEWVQRGRNLGFGRAHNVAFEIVDGASDYHLVVNPDVRVPAGALERLAAFMDAHPDAGIVMPRIRYPDGSLQHVCKLLPTPLDLFARRFLPTGSLSRQQARLEMREFFRYDRTAEVPWLSGSFLFIRTQTARRTGLFDERFFLYLEDTDLSRRFAAVSRNYYFPGVTVTHRHQQQSYRSLRAMLIHIRSAIRYFNKWGWVWDPQRGRINRSAIRALRGDSATAGDGWRIREDP